MLKIRKETEADYQRVEEITRKAFYNMYMPGCVEHYLVHIMRSHRDFIPELDFVLELDGEVVGNIMYTKAKLTDESGQEKEIVTFGPVSILPEYQRKGYGKQLIEYSFEKAAAMLVKELVPGALDGRTWIYQESPAMQIREEDAKRFDDTLEKMEKKWQPSQEEFYILSNAVLG